MTRKLVTVAAAVAALMLSGTFESADAKKGGGWSGGGGKFSGGFTGSKFSGGGKFHGFHSGKFNGGGVHHGHKFARSHHGHKFFRKRHIFIGAPVVYGAYAYGDSCYWLRKRAIYTGSPYWWDRYYDCLYGNGYY